MIKKHERDPVAISQSHLNHKKPEGNNAIPSKDQETEQDEKQAFHGGGKKPPGSSPRG